MKRSSNERVWKPARTSTAAWFRLPPWRCQASTSSATKRASSWSSHRPATRTCSPCLVLGPQRLAVAGPVARDHARRGAQYVPGRAVVALQPDHLGAGEILLEAQDVADLGTAPAVDRLVVVADAGDVLVAACEQAQPEILGDVGVLILVDQDGAEPPLVLRQHVGLAGEQGQAVQQQIAEVAGVQGRQPLLVGGVELDTPCPSAKSPASDAGT